MLPAPPDDKTAPKAKLAKLGLLWQFARRYPAQLAAALIALTLAAVGNLAIPQGFKRGRPFRQYDWQFWCTANHYRIREDAKYDPDDPPFNQAFVYRLTQVIAPQKTGKGPMCACWTCVAAVGPELFVVFPKDAL